MSLGETELHGREAIMEKRMGRREGRKWEREMVKRESEGEMEV